MTQSKRSQIAPLKVVHLASGDLWAGAESQLLTLATALQSDISLKLEFVLLNDGQLARELRRSGCSVTVFDEKVLSSLSILFRLTMALRKSSPDLLHTHRRKENILGGMAAIAANVPYSVKTIHGADEHPPAVGDVRRHALKFLDHIVAKFVQDRIIAVSKPLFESFFRVYGSKVRYIPNGVDVESLRTASLDKLNSLKSTGCINVAFVGRLVPVKRVDIFLQTALITAAAAPNKFKFHIFGDGPGLEDTKSFVSNNNLRELVRIVGFVSNMSVELSKMDLLLITSDSEGLPMALLEAVVLEVPVISRSVGDIAEVLNHGHGGALVDGGDPKKFASVLLEYERDNSIFAARARVAHENVRRKYSSVVNGKEYANVYTEIITQ